jgi:hypothetical protein
MKYHICVSLKLTAVAILIILRLNNNSFKGPVQMDYELDGRASIPGRATDFSLLHSVQTGSGSNPTSYSMGTKGLFPGGKAAGA